MRPVSDEFPESQGFGSNATAGVVGNYNGTQVQVLVALYGNYQPYGHGGGDIACPVGTPVRAMKSGTVVWCDWDVHLPGGPNGYSQRWDFYQSFGGRIVLLQHGPSEFTAYCHLSEFRVTRGQRVNEGDVIALSGDSSGGSDGVLGAHLHTEYIVDTSYRTGNGLIYGRTDPSALFGGINPQGTITSEDELSQAEVVQIQGFINEGIDRAINDLRARVGAVPNAILNAEIPRGGQMAGSTSLAAMVSWNDNHVIQIISAAAASAANDGATVAQITEAVKKAIAESVVKVNVTVGGTK